MSFSMRISVLLLLSITALGHQYAPHSSTEVILTDANVFANGTYEYIIIGGGTAGLVLATRLAETHSVGVIEAGVIHRDEPLIDVPFFTGQSLGNPNLDWGFTTVPQPNLNGRTIGADRGKVLGGSSALNFLIFGRGSKAEYDSWEALGNPGWNWNNLLPYFKKAASVTPGDPDIFPGTHGSPGTFPEFQGKHGPIHVSYNTQADFLSGLFAPFAKAVQNIGVKANPNPDSGVGTGVFQTARSVDSVLGKRSYAISYINETQHRGSLRILTGAEATQINFLKQWNGTQRATGCRFDARNQSFSVQASKEVILSAGVFKTPQLLELSGIGNKTILEALGIPVRINLPSVGENMQDHLLANEDFLLKAPAPITYDVIRLDPAQNQSQVERYATSHNGIFAASDPIILFEPLQTFLGGNGTESLLQSLDAEIKSRNLTYLQEAHYSIQRRLIAEGEVGQVELVLFPGWGGVTPTPLEGRSYLSMSTFQSRPFSRGSTHINTTDPKAAPVINPRYLDFDFDSTVLATISQVGRKIAQTDPLAPLIDAPSTPSSDVESMNDFEGFVRDVASTSFHNCGTATMAPKELGGVVDPNLRVYGTSNFRIVDASIIPLLFAAHTQSTVYALAERAADLIKSQCDN